jgi:AraC-like DNA-binding protein
MDVTQKLANMLIDADLSKLIYHYYDRQIPAGWSMGKPHQHEAIEIICCLEGSFHMLIVSGDIDVTVNRGDCLIVRPFAAHYLYVSESAGCRCSCIQLNIRDMYFDKIDIPSLANIFSLSDNGLNKDGYYKLVDHEAIADTVRRILQELSQKYAFQSILLKTELLGLFMRIARSMEKRQEGLDDGENRYVLMAMEYIKQSLNDEITIKPGDIADRLYISEGHLMHLFKHYTQTTIMSAVTELRIEQSQGLLINTDQCVTDIAFKCGYSSLQHFSMVFKKTTGMSPSVYRSMMRDIGHLKQESSADNAQGAT